MAIPETTEADLPAANAQYRKGDSRPLISVVVPGFNESTIVKQSLDAICGYLEGIEDRYRWELLFVNDGSKDDTGRIAEDFSRGRANVRVLHHSENLGLGQALRFAFAQSRGDYVVSLDADLSYAPEHVGSLVEELERTGAKLALASPYMEGGRVSNVPRIRALLSVWANRFLSLMVKGTISTLTGMVRAYDGRFLRGVSLRSTGMDINPEVVHKTLMLGGRIVEVPAHLDWQLQGAKGPGRRSSMRVFSQILAIILSAFLLRPVIFFIVPGLLMLGFSIYVNAWMIAHFLRHFAQLTQYTWIMDRASWAVAAAYQEFPHTFVVGGLSAMLAIQLLSLGVLSLQSKNYFEDLFDLGSRIYRGRRDSHGSDESVS